ncbi:MAG: hypothetical protein LBS12_04025 [Prevotellaceae bacterium]|jgi:hypothetical protein|nr:hypothetical protein [Prevotellaceae bacterium]
MKKNVPLVGHLVVGLAAMAGFVAVFMVLWNWLMPFIFGLPALNFWQAAGFLVLLAGLVKFMTLSAFFGMHGYRRNPLREKWMKMTPEEREEFLKNHHFGRRCRRFAE